MFGRDVEKHFFSTIQLITIGQDKKTTEKYFKKR